MFKFKLLMFVGVIALFFAFTETASAGSATLTWNANTEPDLASYKIYYGTTARTGTCPMGGYTSSLSVGKVTSYTFNNLTNGVTYYFSVTAIDTSGNESCFSPQVSKLVPALDTTAPTVSGGSPSGAQPAGTTQVTLRVTTNENATCKFSTSANTAYTSMTNTFSTTGATSHSQTITGLTNGTSRVYYIRCRDAANNANGSDYAVSFSVSQPSDSTAPVISAGAPTGAQPAGTTQVTLRVTTNENATCKYSTNANTAYASMGSFFALSGALSHTQTISGLSNGTSRNYYVRCQDSAGNVNTSDYLISFSVSQPSDSSAPVISAGAPSGAQPAGTTQVTMSVTTNENATCKYSTNANTSYASMISTFSSTGALTHTQSITGLTNGVSRTYYVRCRDAANNANASDYAVSFNVSNTIPVIRADVDQNSVINTSDALLTLRYSIGLSMSGTNWVSSATTGDVDCSGGTKSNDAQLILRKALGLSMTGTGWCL